MLKILDTAHHRNGISGRPFSVVLFSDSESGDVKVMIRFDNAPDCVAVLSVDQLTDHDIKFGSNSWRGDEFSLELDEILGKI